MTTSSRPRLLPLWALVLALAVVVGLPRPASAQERGLLQYARPYNQYGVNVFEPLKVDTLGYNGFRLYWGAAFTQQFQALNHDNEADLVLADPSNPNSPNQNELIDIGAGFNLATANLLLGAQLADGIRVNLITYLSSRHHPEAWVKGGYVQADRLPMLGSDAVDRVMDYLTIRLGHFEINYGDAHFRRTDNGMAMYNPFVGNYVMDAFTTEVGGEVYVQHAGFLGMLGLTGGEIRGAVERPDERAPSYYGKLGVDRTLGNGLRLRLTGSAYTTTSSLNNTLYGGDRAGSRYYLVLENTQARAASNFTSGRYNPNFRDAITAFQLNPFVLYRGLEVFGVVETASGRLASETEDRTWNQYAVDVLYRFAPRDQFYVGGRYNTVSGELPFSGGQEASITRFGVGAGWFATPNLLLKAEYVDQQYDDFPSTDIYHEGSFDGFVIEGVLAF